jgi:hypothetical protein
MYQVIKGIGLPERLNSNCHLYPLEALEVGDGFDVPDDLGVYPSGGSKRMSSLRNAFSQMAKKVPGWKGKVRLIPGTEMMRAVRVA